MEDRGPWRAARGCRVRHDLASEQQTNNPLLATRKDAGFFFFFYSAKVLIMSFSRGRLELFGGVWVHVNEMKIKKLMLLLKKKKIPQL